MKTLSFPVMLLPCVSSVEQHIQPRSRKVFMSTNSDERLAPPAHPYHQPEVQWKKRHVVKCLLNIFLFTTIFDALLRGTPGHGRNVLRIYFPFATFMRVSCNTPLPSFPLHTVTLFCLSVLLVFHNSRTKIFEKFSSFIVLVVLTITMHSTFGNSTVHFHSPLFLSHHLISFFSFTITFHSHPH